MIKSTFTEHYVKTLKKRYKEVGASSMLHGNCGRQPKHTIDVTIKQKILEIRLYLKMMQPEV